MRSDLTGPPARSFIETARRAQLVETAIATVNELGYPRSSLAEIARRAGVAKSAIVYYFASKDALLLEVVETVFAELGAELLAAVEGVAAPADRLSAYADAYLGHVDEHRAAIAAAVDIVVSHRTADGTPLYLLEDESDTALLRDVIAEGVSSGSFRPIPLAVAVGLVESVLDHAITTVQRDPGADLSGLRAEAGPFLMRALTAAPDG